MERKFHHTTTKYFSQPNRTNELKLHKVMKTQACETSWFNFCVGFNVKIFTIRRKEHAAVALRFYTCDVIRNTIECMNDEIPRTTTLNFQHATYVITHRQNVPLPQLQPTRILRDRKFLLARLIPFTSYGYEHSGSLCSLALRLHCCSSQAK